MGVQGLHKVSLWFSYFISFLDDQESWLAVSLVAARARRYSQRGAKIAFGIPILVPGYGQYDGRAQLVT